MREVMFFQYVKVYLFWKFIQYTIHWDETQMLKKKFLWTKSTLQKMRSFYFWELQLITVLLLIRSFYTSWSTWFIALKLCVGFSIFESVSFLSKFILLFNKKHELFDFKRHKSFQNNNNRKATHSFALRPLIFKLQQEVWKFNDICRYH